MSFFKQLIRILASLVEPTSTSSRSSRVSPSDQPSGPSGPYYATMTAMQEAISDRDYERAASLARKNIKQIPAWVNDQKRQFGANGVPPSIPVFGKGGTMLVLMGDEEGLKEMEDVLNSIPDRPHLIETVEQHWDDLDTVRSIKAAIAENPGCKQTEIKKLIGAADGRRPATLLAWLDKHGDVVRVKSGRTYQLYLPGDAPEVEGPPDRKPTTQRSGRHATETRTLDIADRGVVHLPRAPHSWEDHDERRSLGRPSEIDTHFEIFDSPSWGFSGEIEFLPMQERPDTAYRKMFTCNTGVYLVDDLGNAEDMGAAPASAIRYGRSGEILARQALLYDTYRLAVHPMGEGLAALSEDGVLHAYDSDLSLLLETPLVEAPEIKSRSRRFGTDPSSLKRHVRCIGLSPGNQRYLFTHADALFVIERASEKGMWSVEMPKKEGWGPVAQSAGRAGPAVEIQEAMELMDLDWPFTSGDVKKRYRNLAMEWHPDRNPDDPRANERMARLISAVELLTGSDAHALDIDVPSRFRKVMERHEIDVGHGMKIEMSLQVGGDEAAASDWIYAASFGAQQDSVFLASYSGRVVELGQSGEPLRAYDVGAVPEQIIDTGDYLYLLTSTRLYVLEAERLHRIVDVFGAGTLVMAQTGFGLLEDKQFRWFEEAGEYVGRIVTDNPIRRVYWSGKEMVVETRQRRARIDGVKTWWE